VDIYAERGGSGSPVLLLLHGLGATGTVWQGLADLLTDHWPGSWVIPDLPGHGRSDHAGSYSFAGFAAGVGRLVDSPVVVLGHSLGGVVGLHLGVSGQASAVCGVGIKVQWASGELAKAAELAGRPSKVFATREEAADRSLRVAGLTGLVSPESPLVEPGLRSVDGGWSLAMDPRTFAVGDPSMPSLLSACTAPVLLAAGERDPMSPQEHLRELVPTPVMIDKLGHNAHVEDPTSMLPLLEWLRG
jgi:pimeloyl-ACP methyl ester carboxylesterase